MFVCTGIFCDSAGSPGGISDSLTVAVLVGDANDDGGVSSADAGSISQRLGQQTDAANFRHDVNADGAISSADSASATQRLGNVSPVCP